jgi:hypothetical protein
MTTSQLKIALLLTLPGVLFALADLALSPSRQ